MTEQQMLDIDAVIAELTPLGRAEFDAALARAQNKTLQARVERLEAQLSGQTGAAQRGNGQYPVTVDA